MSQRNYASFIQRFAAFLIDMIILLLVSRLTLGQSEVNENTLSESELLKLFVYRVFYVVLAWLYYAILESSQIQGTLGKQVVGISVTDLQGDKISFGKATVRYFGKSFCVVIWIAAGLILSIGEATGNENSPYFIVTKSIEKYSLT